MQRKRWFSLAGQYAIVQEKTTCKEGQGGRIKKHGRMLMTSKLSPFLCRIPRFDLTVSRGYIIIDIIGE
jgi:hypothetical protein